MAPEPILTTHFKNPFLQSTYMILARQRLGKISLSLLGKGAVKTSAQQRLRTK
jgi:hypothetical protein